MYCRTEDFSTPICFCVKCSLFCQQGILLVHQWSGCNLVNSTTNVQTQKREQEKKKCKKGQSVMLLKVTKVRLLLVHMITQNTLHLSGILLVSSSNPLAPL